MPKECKCPICRRNIAFNVTDKGFHAWCCDCQIFVKGKSLREAITLFHQYVKKHSKKLKATKREDDKFAMEMAVLDKYNMWARD